MDNGIKISSISMYNREKQHEIIAHNISNIDTDYYKARGINFIEINNKPEILEFINNTSGPIQTTKNNLDLFINNGFLIRVMDENNNIYFINNGKLTIDSEGFLSYKGLKVLNTSGEFINISQPEDLIIKQDGTIYHDGKIEKISIVQVEDGFKLKEIQPNIFEIDNKFYKEAESYNIILQGFIEKSNVNRVNEITKLINLIHIYEASQKSLITHDEVISKTINEMGKF